ncbi:MAG TPA: mechanosensitive ion channel [Alphaproteobacteria bacterium]|nr:mechanosensitive ion channel [Alphaproteobacteria bacterium]
MKHFIILIAILCSLVSFGSVVNAADGEVSIQAVSDQAVSDQAAPVEDKDVSRLIDTLENDESRAAFVGDLKLLVEKQKEQEIADKIEPLTEAIGVRAKVSEAVVSYENFLEEHNLSSSIVHQGAGTSIVLLIAGGFFLGVRQMSRKILKIVDRFSQKIGVRLSRFNVYTKILQVILKVFICGIAVYTLGKIWSIGVLGRFFESEQLREFLGTTFTVLFVAFFAAVVWEAVGVYLSYVFKQADDRNQTRVKTLLPILRNAILIVFAILFGLVLMSEIGINVTPLLAGAGVVGVAIGFGAQTMVKDFLSGFTIILEDLIRVGDVASVGGCTGLVEKITLRKVQMRDMAGTVYTIPFSEITTVQNLTKDFSYYVMDIGVTYHVDTDRVVEVLRQVDEDLRADSEYTDFILEPIEILGVDQFADSAVVVKARIKTRPIKQWFVGREFNRRMKHAFDRAGIEIPFPQRTVTVVRSGGDDGTGQAEKQALLEAVSAS